MYKILWMVVALLAGCAAPQVDHGFDESRLVDLSYAFDENTVYWPTATRFTRTEVAHGHTEAGWWYASNDFAASEHGGTHMDAPIHFAEGMRTTDQVPLTQLTGPGRVIDVREHVRSDSDYLLSPADIEAHEADHGPIEAGDIVLVWTGFGERYPDPKAYLGSDVRGVAEDLHFPGIGEDAAQLLVERNIDMIGLDTASLDHGPSKNFIAHQILNGANIPGLENVANMELLPPRGATIIALPMKIRDGSGGPCRIVALLPGEGS